MSILKLVTALMLLSSSLAYSHARLRPGSTTPPRDESTGLKTAPCGGIARTANPLYYKPGQEIKVQWEETINHPGYFIVSFSEDGDLNFEKNILIPKFVDTQDEPIEEGKTHLYEASVKLPNLLCEACTIQLIQVMTEDPANPRNYYSCSDIKLTHEPQPKPVPKPDDKGKPAPPTGVKVKRTN